MQRMWAKTYNKKIAYFGTNESDRIIALSRCGYCVEVCATSVPRLRAVLHAAEVDAIVIEGWGEPMARAATVARRLSSAPLVLFEGANMNCDPSKFDLVISSRTPPSDWHDSIDKIIDLYHVSASNLMPEALASFRHRHGFRPQSARLDTVFIETHTADPTTAGQCSFASGFYIDERKPHLLHWPCFPSDLNIIDQGTQRVILLTTPSIEGRVIDLRCRTDGSFDAIMQFDRDLRWVPLDANTCLKIGS